MMNANDIALLVYADINFSRDALTEEKYKDLASSFLSEGFKIKSVLYNDESADQLGIDLLKYDAVLVWINPVEQGKDRKRLDALLVTLSDKGCFVSTHPEVILKMGTKDILYKTKDMDWGGDIKMYSTYDDFTRRFPESLQASKIRVLKQYRGNGGNGVYKVIYGSPGGEAKIIHAAGNQEEIVLSWANFYNIFKPFFLNNGSLIDQEWNKNSFNGMVRCYLTGAKVAGFGYQEINALYELNVNTYIPPGKRYYFTENCGLFNDLKEIMETAWVPQLQERLSIANDMMPVIWDADFFINEINSKNAAGKYTLCEINVSCVSPFPPSAIKFIVNEVRNRIKN
ncbi:MAG TPA: Cj0069 family protein [Chitinophagaceae bacterium]|nr:Cj0069 family protein [Chitinophagaceae bacterium]